MRKQKGLALFEVLLALTILSFGLLALLSLQFKQITLARQDYFHHIAVARMADLLERLQANPDQQRWHGEEQLWNVNNRYLLPRGQGGYHCQALRCQINLQWKDHGVKHVSLYPSL